MDSTDRTGVEVSLLIPYARPEPVRLGRTEVDCHLAGRLEIDVLTGMPGDAAPGPGRVVIPAGDVVIILTRLGPCDSPPGEGSCRRGC